MLKRLILRRLHDANKALTHEKRKNETPERINIDEPASGPYTRTFVY